MCLEGNDRESPCETLGGTAHFITGWRLPGLVPGLRDNNTLTPWRRRLKSSPTPTLRLIGVRRARGLAWFRRRRPPRG